MCQFSDSKEWGAVSVVLDFDDDAKFPPLQSKDLSGMQPSRQAMGIATHPLGPSAGID